MSPYHLPCYAEAVGYAFGLEDLSLAAFDDQGNVVGYLPQWRKGNRIESVPWRDKGGPVPDHGPHVSLFLNKTRAMVREQNLAGFIWKDCRVDSLDCRECGVNVNLPLKGRTRDDLWGAVSKRRAVRQGKKNGLVFTVHPPGMDAVTRFYELFVLTRKRLGVPAYAQEVFEALLPCMEQGHGSILSADKDGRMLAGMILLHTRKTAIYAYGGSSDQGRALRANDFLMWNAILHSLNLGAEKFEFGSDSPCQESLIRFKLKWGGSKRIVSDAVEGDISHLDHTTGIYALAGAVFRRLPLPLFKLASRLVIR
ncbi:GNAT family N-acetyltransferase [Desulfovibrio sp. JC010]|uniref:GNAT family N-acetyltransferase n=1 Tax=Desulfovibrio sp. JC010 TaxID=2593641 RepID=UPI0013D373B3|nr:GNAT family N-acetyltransferase [Desulfovibrio sp. JC010]